MNKFVLLSILFFLPCLCYPVITNGGDVTSKANGKVVLIKGARRTNESLEILPDNRIKATIENRKMVIEFFYDADSRMIMVIDSRERMVYQKELEGSNPETFVIDLHGFLTGSYTLLIEENGEIVAHGRFSVEGIEPPEQPGDEDPEEPLAGNWINYLEEESIVDILNDGDYLWIATHAGLVKFNKQTGEETFYTSENSGLSSNGLRLLMKDKENNIWIGTFNQGINKFDGTTFETVNVQSSDNPLNMHVVSMAIDDSGNKWFNSQMCLNKLDGNNQESWTIPFSCALVVHFFHPMKFDKEGTLWMGIHDVYNYHLTKFSDGQVQGIPGFMAHVNAIEIDDDNNKWLATSWGLIKYDGEEFTVYDFYGSLQAIKRDLAGNLWMANGLNLIKFNGNKFNKYEVPLLNNHPQLYDLIFCIEPDNEGNVWIGTRTGGLFKFTPEGECLEISLKSSLAPTGIDQLKLNTDTSIPERIEVYDISGKLLSSFKPYGVLDSLEASDLNINRSGVYLIKTIDGNNRPVIKKIILH